ncbi:MAG: hypothetical protein QOK11_2212 [Pseudonocardiales bacterium]|nr:hypothetical protein [Pseudonocardiales bacterium]
MTGHAFVVRLLRRSSFPAIVDARWAAGTRQVVLDFETRHEIPCRAATLPLRIRLTGSGLLWPAWLRSSVATITASICSSLIRRGPPGRGSSSRPSRRWSTNRRRHLLTVAGTTPSFAATCLLSSPCAQASTILDRNARNCADFARRAAGRWLGDSFGQRAKDAPVKMAWRGAHGYSWPPWRGSVLRSRYWFSERRTAQTALGVRLARASVNICDVVAK